MSENAHDASDLPPRRETFLARYPRNIKLAVTAILFAAIVLPPAWMYGQGGGRVNISLIPSYSLDEGREKGAEGAGEGGTEIPALNDQNDRTIKLVPAPDNRVTEDTGEGSLPRISEDGDRPWQIYARPFNISDKRPRIALVITDLGLSRAITDQAIAQLPPVVTLAFNSQAPAVAAWGTRARQDGHEILLQIPVEPFDYPRSDPGPDTLLSNLSNTENLARLLKAMRRGTGYIGVTMVQGTRFASDPVKFDLILEVLRARGLMVLDARAILRGVVTEKALSAGVPVATVTDRLDGDLDPGSIATALENLEKTARQTGHAIGITAATPAMISQIQAWADKLPERGIALAPLSVMVQ